MSEWRKSSFSGNGGCWELSRDPSGQISIRNSDFPNEWVTDSNVAFGAFLAGAKAGEFDHLVRQPSELGGLWLDPNYVPELVVPTVEDVT